MFLRPKLFRSIIAVLLTTAVLLPLSSGMYDSTDSVEELTEDNFEEEVLQSEDYWLVEFYAPWCGHCQKLAPEWKKAAKELHGVARLGAVNCDDEKSVCSKYGVKGFPTIKAFGNDKQSPTDYQQGRDASSIVSFVKEHLGPGAASSKLVTSLTYLDTYFFLHEDNTPKVLLLTKGERKAPSWIASLAIKYKDGRQRSVKFAHADVDLQPQIAKNFKLEKFPVLITARITGTWKEGRGFYSTFTSLAGLKGSESIKTSKEVIDDIALGDFDEESLMPLPAFPPPDTPKKLAPTTFAKLDSDNIDTHCFGGSKPICVLAFVSPEKGTEEFPEKVELLALSRKYRNDPFSFVWLEVDNQAEFVGAFGLEPRQTPALAVVKHGKRTRFALHSGTFTSQSMSDFLDRTLGGDLVFKPLNPVPELVPPYLQDSDVTDE